MISKWTNKRNHNNTERKEHMKWIEKRNTHTQNNNEKSKEYATTHIHTHTNKLQVDFVGSKQIYSAFMIG